jgi:transposase
MDRAIVSTLQEDALYVALELSKNSWLLAIQFPDRPQPSLHSIAGGDTAVLMAKLRMARERWAKLSGKAPSMVVCYEAGYDAFWLARFLNAQGIECLVVDAASLQVNRRGRRAKTDRIDVGMLLRGLIAWRRGDRHVCRWCVFPVSRKRICAARTASANAWSGSGRLISVARQSGWEERRSG